MSDDMSSVLDILQDMSNAQDNNIIEDKKEEELVVEEDNRVYEPFNIRAFIDELVQLNISKNSYEEYFTCHFNIVIY